MATPLPTSPAPLDDRPDEEQPGAVQLKAFVLRLENRVREYLQPRTDRVEQLDHLRHVADRTRWVYYSELQRARPGASVRIPAHEDALIQACVFSHDIGKWIPREELKVLIPEPIADLRPVFNELKFTTYQSELFLLGVRRRFALEQDGYVPEYDSAHHLVSAFLLVTDPNLGFHQLALADQERLINMIIGHQFGSYFKEQLLALSIHDDEVTTGMLVDVARPDRLLGDTLASAFHDADIADLLMVGSLEPRPNREDIFHTGGLVKILMINFTNLIYGSPRAPRNLSECLRSCQFTVTTACAEFITPTAVEHGQKWRKQARNFLTHLREKSVMRKFNDPLMARDRPPQERLQAVRMQTYLQARSFLKSPDED